MSINNIPDDERKMLEYITEHDLTVLGLKRVEYGDSWKKRGGIGAFFAFVRKWDRIEKRAEEFGYDIFQACNNDDADNPLLVNDSFLDDIGDLRRFLLLVETEMRIRAGIVYAEHYDTN